MICCSFFGNGLCCQSRWTRNYLVGLFGIKEGLRITHFSPQHKTATYFKDTDCRFVIWIVTKCAPSNLIKIYGIEKIRGTFWIPFMTCHCFHNRILLPFAFCHLTLQRSALQFAIHNVLNKVAVEHSAVWPFLQLIFGIWLICKFGCH